MNLMTYWPDKDAVTDCIKPEAEGAHDAVLLAVHQPSTLSYQINKEPKVATTEDDLYAYFTTSDLPMGVHVVPITGESGVGKSHMVRMLAARLKSEDTDNKYVVIRIPKSASLRTVVELILAPLPEEGYAEVKQAFKKAMAEVDLATAVIGFQAQLEIALQDKAVQLDLEANQDLKNTLTKQKLGHARNLSRFMGDPVLVEHFRKNVFERIVQRALAGQTENAEAERITDFTVADFDLPDSIDLSLAASTTANYYKAVLRTNGGAGIDVAVDLLNDKVVDQAIRQLFQLHEALGGMTLQDVILEIRRLLLRDQRELVILVEDFKALTGIQETLLNILIQEGIRDNKQTYATMRSAIAVTDGYLVGQDTIATRAKRQWIVESHLSSDEEVLHRTKRLVASYLNAARWGYEALLQRYHEHAHAWSSDEAWIGPFLDDDAAAEEISAFGTIDGIPLFPFTELAIEGLAHLRLKQHDRLVFTPRYVIDHILIDVLTRSRQPFIEQTFPPSTLIVSPPSAEVAEWLATLNVSPDVRERYARLVTIWGNLPETVADIGRIPPAVFKVFGLESPQLVPPQTTPQPTPKPEHKEKESRSNDDKSRTRIDVSPPEDQRVIDLRASLASWVREGIRLEQGNANLIRKALEQAITDRIDWNAERCSKFSIGSAYISIPHALGEAGKPDDAIRIAPDHQDSEGRLRPELLAVVRYYQFQRRTADYDEADEDLARIGNLVQRLMPQVLTLVRKLAKLRLHHASKLLSTNSRLLGVLERGRTTKGVSDFLFGEPKLPGPLPAEAPIQLQEWRQLQNCALAIRGKLTAMLLEHGGCFQGSGGKVAGIDIVRVLDSYPDDAGKVDTDLLGPIDPDVMRQLPHMREAAVNARAKRVQTEALRVQQVLNDALGNNFDKNEVADTLKALTDSLHGIWSSLDIGMSSSAFKGFCDEFRASPLKEALHTLQAAAQLDEEKTDSKALSRIAQLDISPLIVAHRFVTTARLVTKEAQRRAETEYKNMKDIDVLGEANKIRDTFDSLLKDLDALEAKGEQACC